MPDEKILPRYPVYIPSKGRSDQCQTVRCLLADGVPFFLVVEPSQREAYAAAFGDANLLVLPFENAGSVIPARNWIKAHATAAGFERHWQLDDNIRYFGRRLRGRRLRCAAGVALAVVEDFVDRYENVAIAGMNYYMFLADGESFPPVQINCHVYSCSLILNAIPHRWRGRYNEDTDICLQVLSDGWCTVLVNAFCVQKIQTMAIAGGNTADLYRGDGRLRMARALERLWPGVVTVNRRFKRAQHIIKYAWRRFDTPLRLKSGIDLAALAPNEYGMKVVAIQPVRSPRLRALLDDLAPTEAEKEPTDV